ncbi:hypothetical protein CEUSTIGMA_g850.t1 [Chlamydomonas eustigma]|uniref:Uncharacterized protein n=1 Tax=Chlamydomonas eustigma TaxID=1157962 RepID=A0A250WRC7_9CHLO|nr:hypothetical protein CEUSTIGMA_g850.t1 [Chlamydomonas eustigma]|eukprot:GAX73397.1 hypothetical protein CEUSTIGMA_g850.t1 [Chlamydomonas eustigma]
MGLQACNQMFHKVEATLTKDPFTLQNVFIVSQMGITETTLAKTRLQRAHAALAAEKERMNALLQRQYSLNSVWAWSRSWQDPFQDTTRQLLISLLECSASWWIAQWMRPRRRGGWKCLK